METPVLAGTWLCFCFFLFYFEMISSCVMSPFVWYPPLFAPHLSFIRLFHLHLFCPLLCLPVPSSPPGFPPFGSCFLRFIYCLYLFLGFFSCFVIALLLLSFGHRFSSLFSKAPTCMRVFFAFGSHFVESDKHIEPFARCIYVCLSVCLWTDVGRVLAS